MALTRLAMNVTCEVCGSPVGNRRCILCRNYMCKKCSCLASWPDRFICKTCVLTDGHVAIIWHREKE